MHILSVRSIESQSAYLAPSAREIIKALLICATATATATGCKNGDDKCAEVQEVKPAPAASPSIAPAKADKPICPERAPHNPPVIGFSGDMRSPEELGARTKQWVAQAGGKAIRLNTGNFEDKKCDIDGVVLNGGNDIEGRLFGETSHSSIKPLEAGRYEFDMQLVRLAEQVRLPIMGVCLGSQELWVREGGSLVQDIPSEIPGYLNHRQPHAVTFTKGSFLSGVYPNGLEAWSSHHQANDAKGSHGDRKPTDAFSITGHSADGVVEAIESKDMEKKFVLGIQWHPTDDSGVKLYRAFIDRAKR